MGGERSPISDGGLVKLAAAVAAEAYHRAKQGPEHGRSSWAKAGAWFSNYMQQSGELEWMR